MQLSSTCSQYVMARLIDSCQRPRQNPPNGRYRAVACKSRSLRWRQRQRQRRYEDVPDAVQQNAVASSEEQSEDESEEESEEESEAGGKCRHYALLLTAQCVRCYL